MPHHLKYNKEFMDVYQIQDILGFVSIYHLATIIRARVFIVRNLLIHVVQTGRRG